MLKRCFDFLSSSLGLLLLSPMFLVVAIWIKRDSSGPVFYRGVRVGRHGRSFRIFKFRSMVTGADRIGPASTSGTDPRVTRSGAFIRRWKLDEFAQLLNVIKGDMSLVGPRPEVQHFVDMYTDEERALLTLRPGITDWASIWNSDEGGVLAGAADADGMYERVLRPTKVRLQLRYLHRRSFLADLRIVGSTVIRIFVRDYTPAEIRDCPGFAELRAEVEGIIAEDEAAARARVQDETEIMV